MLLADPALSLVLNLGKTSNINERLMQFVANELSLLSSSAALTFRSLEAFRIILADPDTDWRFVYARFCYWWKLEDFFTVLFYAQRLPEGIVKSKLLCRECLRQVDESSAARRELWRRQSPLGAPEEPYEVAEDELIGMFSRTPSAPFPLRFWCFSDAYQLAIESSAYSQIDLLLHMTSVCFWPNNMHLRRLLPLLIAQIPTAPLMSINRLLLSIHSSSLPLHPVLHDALCRRICMGSHPDIVQQISGKFFNCPQQRAMDCSLLWGFFAITFDAQDGVALGHSDRLVLFRMFLRQTTTRPLSDTILASLNIDMRQINDVDREDFFVDLLHYRTHAEKTRILEILGLDEARDVISALPNFFGGSMMGAPGLSDMPINMLVKYYRRFRFGHLPSSRLPPRVPNQWELYIIPQRIVAGITFDMVRARLLQIISSPQSFVVRIVSSPQGADLYFRPRLNFSQSILRTALYLMLYGIIRFQKPVAYLQPVYCQALLGSQMGMREIINNEDQHWLGGDRLRPTPDNGSRGLAHTAQQFCWTSQSLFNTIHLAWDLRIIIPNDRLCSFLSAPFTERPSYV